MERKFCRVDSYLRLAVGVEMEKLPANMITPENTPGVAEVYHFAPRNSKKVYLDLANAGEYPQKIEVRVPRVLSAADWGEILFSNTRVGAQVLFGREGEEAPFGPTNGKYVTLRLYRESEHSFNPVYARVDKGPDTRFFSIKARWYGDTITVEIDRDPPWAEIPTFLS